MSNSCEHKKFNFLIFFRAKNEVDTKNCAKKNEGQKINNKHWNRKW